MFGWCPGNVCLAADYTWLFICRLQLIIFAEDSTDINTPFGIYFLALEVWLFI